MRLGDKLQLWETFAACLFKYLGSYKYSLPKLFVMSFLSLEPFVPSGKNFPAAKEFFKELGFSPAWDAGNYVGFASGNCRFILQNYDDDAFAANLMINVKVADVQEFRAKVIDADLPGRFGIRIGAITQQPYGKEVNIIDAAGVCWHFVE